MKYKTSPYSPHRVNHRPVQRVGEQLRLRCRNLFYQTLDVFAFLLGVSPLYAGQSGSIHPEALVVVIIQGHELPLSGLFVGLFVVKLVKDAVHRQLLPLHCVGLTGASCGTCGDNKELLEYIFQWIHAARMYFLATKTKSNPNCSISFIMSAKSNYIWWMIVMFQQLLVSIFTCHVQPFLNLPRLPLQLMSWYFIQTEGPPILSWPLKLSQ